jgi:hypothetical protein
VAADRRVCSLGFDTQTWQVLCLALPAGGGASGAGIVTGPRAEGVGASQAPALALDERALFVADGGTATGSGTALHTLVAGQDGLSPVGTLRTAQVDGPALDLAQEGASLYLLSGSDEVQHLSRWDVTSPAAPVHRATLVTALGGRLVSREGLVIVASEQEIKVVQPAGASLVVRGTLALPATGSGELAVGGGRVYVDGGRSGVALGQQVLVLDTTDPDRPAWRQQIPFGVGSASGPRDGLRLAAGCDDVALSHPRIGLKVLRLGDPLPVERVRLDLTAEAVALACHRLVAAIQGQLLVWDLDPPVAAATPTVPATPEASPSPAPGRSLFLPRLGADRAAGVRP